MVAVKKAGKRTSVKGGTVDPSGGGNFTFANSDFVELSRKRARTVALIFGEPGQGKTTLATMYAPQPVTVINFDNRADDRVIEALAAGRRVLHAHISCPTDTSRMASDMAMKLGQEALARVMHNLEVAVRESQRGNCRTICLDTGTELSDFINVANTGTAQSVKGDYGKSKGLLNRQWWNIFSMAREGDANLLVLARSKEIWYDSQPTGKMTYRGPDVMLEGVDWAARVGTVKNKRTGQPKKPARFELEITKAGNNIAELGEVYAEDDWDGLGGPFAYAAMMQHPDTSPDDWE